MKYSPEAQKMLSAIAELEIKLAAVANIYYDSNGDVQYGNIKTLATTLQPVVPQQQQAIDETKEAFRILCRDTIVWCSTQVDEKK